MSRHRPSLKRFYIARCAQCDMDLPFEDETKRDEWVAIHQEVVDDKGFRHAVTRSFVDKKVNK